MQISLMRLTLTQMLIMKESKKPLYCEQGPDFRALFFYFLKHFSNSLSLSYS